METQARDAFADAIYSDLSNPHVTFAAPWQAQAFALVVQMHRNAHFTWDHWVAVLSGHIAASPAQENENANDAYYRQWLAALEDIVVHAGIVSADAIPERTELWRLAYINTPHGQAVDLLHATCPPDQSHAAHAHGKPVTISPPVASAKGRPD